MCLYFLASYQNILIFEDLQKTINMSKFIFFSFLFFIFFLTIIFFFLCYLQLYCNHANCLLSPAPETKPTECRIDEISSSSLSLRAGRRIVPDSKPKLIIIGSKLNDYSNKGGGVAKMTSTFPTLKGNIKKRTRGKRKFTYE